MPEELVGPEHRRIRNVDAILRENQALYDRVFWQINEGGTGFRVGQSSSVMKAMVHYFPPPTAEIIALLGREPKTAEQVAKESGKPLDHVKEILHKYWLSGLAGSTKAFVEEQGYVLPKGMGSVIGDHPHCDGLHGTYKMWDEDEEREVGLLMSKIYFEEGWLYQWGADKQPRFMVLVDERQVDNPSTMESWEKGSEHILRTEQVGIVRCGCRVRHGAYNNCKWTVEKPLIDVCLVFDSFMEGWVERGAGTWTTKADALDVLWYGLDAGVVSTTGSVSSIPGNSRFICQCCPCCCHIVAPHARLGITGAGAHRSNFDPRTDLKKCTAGDCGGDAACVKACPVPGVRFYHPPTKRDKSDEFIGLDVRRCMGCGLCAGACPEKAIKMVKARNWIPGAPEAREKAGRHEFIDVGPTL